MQVIGLASFSNNTIPTKTGLRELIKSQPENVILVPVNQEWTPADFAARGPAVKLPQGLEFVVTPWNGKWTATIRQGRNGLTVK